MAIVVILVVIVAIIMGIVLHRYCHERNDTFQFAVDGNSLKWYYDQKIISFFSSDFESVFA